MRKGDSGFAAKVRSGKKTIIYELLPPPKHLSHTDLERSFSLFSAMVKNFPIDAINVPEVREESRNGTRQDSQIVKLEPRKVCSLLRKYHVSEFIINRPVVYVEWEKQREWFQETYQNYGVHNYVLVGGESSAVTYPGLSVNQVARELIQLRETNFPELLLGGITIATRENEAMRVWKKSLAGIEYFTTQVLYESDLIKQELKSYWEMCQQSEVAPKMIFLSFAPITSPADVKLLQWLGVRIPDETLEMLTTGWLGMGWRSLQICQDILEDILQFIDKERIRVPVGLNVEHINRHNLEPSFILLERLCEIYRGDEKFEQGYKLV